MVFLTFRPGLRLEMAERALNDDVHASFSICRSYAAYGFKLLPFSGLCLTFLSCMPCRKYSDGC
jgi:hypothetical protein